MAWLVISGCPLAEQMSLSQPAVFVPQQEACSNGLGPLPMCLVSQQSDCEAFGGGASGCLSVGLAGAVLTFYGAEADGGTAGQAGPPQSLRRDACSALLWPQHPVVAF